MLIELQRTKEILDGPTQEFVYAYCVCSDLVPFVSKKVKMVFEW